MVRDFFSRQHLHLIFEDLESDNRSFLTKLAHWLEIDPTLFPFDDLHVENKIKRHRIDKLQKYALRFNYRFELLWRRYPALKRTLRGAYYLVNAKRDIEQISASERAELETIFAPHNANLFTLLSANGYTDFPNWVTRDVVESS